VTTASPRLLAVLAAAVAIVFLWSGIGPYDRFTWVLEVAPVLLAMPVLVFTWGRFPLTRLVYVLIAIHMIILMVGGHYTYARVPLFDSIRDVIGGARNSYDGVGHFAQGFIPALVAREVLLRTTALARGRMLAYLVLMVCMGMSAIYELVEWGTAYATGEAANDFLGSQGDPWDTQKDMGLCLLGGMLSLAIFSPLHDRELGK
jgi:putative membrane protein